MRKILIVDDDESLAYGIKRSLSGEFKVSVAPALSDAVNMISQKNYSLIFLDFMLGNENGLDVLATIKKISNVPVVMLTAHSSTALIIDAIRAGAVDFISKPASAEQLKEVIIKYALKEKNSYDPAQYHDISSLKVEKNTVIAVSDQMKNVLKSVALISSTDSPVLITGESGTGKDVTAGLIHTYSKRMSSPFVQINCAAIPDALLESELFGYAKGAFTGAYTANQGKFQAADGGTVFLDEIGDMPLVLQSKLLQVLQDGRIQRVGDNTFNRVNIRIISATNKDLKILVEKGLFREDLYYRINAFNIHIPPLRERPADIWDAALHFIKTFSAETGKDIRYVENSAREFLETYKWHGNIRELKNIMSKAVVLSNSEVLMREDFISLLPAIENDGNNIHAFLSTEYRDCNLQKIVEDIEVYSIQAALVKSGNNYTATAKALGISRVTLYEKIKKYQLSKSLSMPSMYLTMQLLFEIQQEYPYLW